MYNFQSILTCLPSYSSEKQQQNERMFTNTLHPPENEDLVVVVCVILYMVTTLADQINCNLQEGSRA